MHLKFWTRSFSLATAAVLLVASCRVQKVPTTTDLPETVTYTAHVRPIIDASCGTKCHSAAKKAAGIDLSHYEGVKDEGTNGKMLAAIQHLEGAERMPRLAPKLDDHSISLIMAWVNGGGLE